MAIVDKPLGLLAVLNETRDMAMRSKPWMVIRHVEIEDLGLIAGVMAEDRILYDTVNVFENQDIPENVDGLGGVILMGGPMGVYEESRYPFLQREDRLLRNALETELPILGICLGSQLLAKAAGGRVYKGPRREIGWRAVHLTAEGKKDPAMGTVSENPIVFHWHGDTFDLPSGAVLLASSERYANQAYRIGSCAYGLQFHLEVEPEMIDRWLSHPDNLREMKDVSDETSPDMIRAGAGNYSDRLAADARAFFKAFFRIATGCE